MREYDMFKVHGRMAGGNSKRIQIPQFRLIFRKFMNWKIFIYFTNLLLLTNMGYCWMNGWMAGWWWPVLVSFNLVEFISEKWCRLSVSWALTFEQFSLSRSHHFSTFVARFPFDKIFASPKFFILMYLNQITDW